MLFQYGILKDAYHSHSSSTGLTPTHSTQPLMTWLYMSFSPAGRRVTHLLNGPEKLVLTVDWNSVERKSDELPAEPSVARMFLCLVVVDPGSGWNRGLGVTSSPFSSNTWNRIWGHFSFQVMNCNVVLSWQEHASKSKKPIINYTLWHIAKKQQHLLLLLYINSFFDNFLAWNNFYFPHCVTLTVGLGVCREPLSEALLSFKLNVTIEKHKQHHQFMA